MLRLSLVPEDKYIDNLFGIFYEIRTTRELQRQAGYSSSYFLVNSTVFLVLIVLLIVGYLLIKAKEMVTEYKPDLRQVPHNGRT